MPSLVVLELNYPCEHFQLRKSNIHAVLWNCSDLSPFWSLKWIQDNHCFSLVLLIVLHLNFVIGFKFDANRNWRRTCSLPLVKKFLLSLSPLSFLGICPPSFAWQLFFSFFCFVFNSKCVEKWKLNGVTASSLNFFSLKCLVFNHFFHLTQGWAIEPRIRSKLLASIRRR